MRGTPKTLNSKFDYLFIKDHKMDGWQKRWQRLLDSQFSWQPEKELAKKEDGIEDETHQIRNDKLDIDGADKWVQYTLKSNPKGEIFRLGFTVKEVEDGLKG